MTVAPTSHHGSGPRPSSPATLTYEGLADNVVALLHREGVLPAAGRAPWDSFFRLSTLVHDQFEIPSTTVTPILRRLLFALGFAAKSCNVVGVGTYVGYAFAWLVRNRSDSEAAPFCEAALGIDIDPEANRLARRNSAVLEHGGRLQFADADGTLAASYPALPIDLLYLDLDRPDDRKAGYLLALDAASSRLRPAALILAHDPCVPLFAADFDAYHRYIRESARFNGPWILPVDECGLSVAAVA